MDNYVYVVHLYEGSRNNDVESVTGVFFWMSSRLDYVVQEIGKYLKRACPSVRRVAVEYISQDGFEIAGYSTDEEYAETVLWFDITRSRV